jgi:ribosomal protein L24E
MNRTKYLIIISDLLYSITMGKYTMAMLMNKNKKSVKKKVSKENNLLSDVCTYTGNAVCKGIGELCVRNSIISRRIRSRIPKCFIMWIRGPGDIVWWKKAEGRKSRDTVLLTVFIELLKIWILKQCSARFVREKRGKKFHLLKVASSSALFV